jgi:hypothetical protein
MKTEFHSMRTELETTGWPLDPAVIPNHMGINLCSVEGMSWTRQDDGQLVSLTIHFQPAAPGEDPGVAVNANLHTKETYKDERVGIYGEMLQNKD